MKFKDYSYRHGKELMKLTHEEELEEISSILDNLPKFAHGSKKNVTVKKQIASAFVENGWTNEYKISLSEGKEDFCDLYKDKIAIEQEYSRFEMFFRDFFRFLLLYDQRKIDVGVIITYGELAYKNWGSAVKSYRAARAALQRLITFLEGDYKTVVRIPLWCIGIE